MRIRPATQADAASCAAIYEHYVLGSPATFELVPPSAEEMGRRIAGSHLWLVAAGPDGEVIGFAYGAEHRARAAYRFATDTTVYLDPAHTGRGVGKALYRELIPALRDLGFWVAVAGVTPPNPASERLHRAMGFEPVGTYRRIGWKGGAWHDVIWLALDLRPGDQGPPE